jgi:hypothetical protein
MLENLTPILGSIFMVLGVVAMCAGGSNGRG